MLATIGLSFFDIFFFLWFFSYKIPNIVEMKKGKV